MKTLKTTLGVVYPVLIILLLLSNCKGCRENGEPSGVFEEPIDTIPEIIEPIDSASLVQQAQQTGQSGNLKITLLWNFQGDIDLHVTQPNGNTIYFGKNRDRSTGGFLDVDNLRGGNGAAENIFWEIPPKGVYKVSLNYYQPSTSSGIAESGVCSVVVFQDNMPPKTYQVRMEKVNDTKEVIRLNIQ